MWGENLLLLKEILKWILPFLHLLGLLFEDFRIPESPIKVEMSTFNLINQYL